MAERESNGQFKKGHSGNPKGRPRLDVEQRYLQVLRKALPQYEVDAIVKALTKRAKRGDAQAAKLLLGYAIGKPTQYVKTDVSGTLELIRVIGGADLDKL